MTEKSKLPSETAPDAVTDLSQASNPEPGRPRRQVAGLAGLRKPPPTQGRGGNKFPNADVIAHTGERFFLHDDLIKGRVVMVNFMSIRGHDGYPATEHIGRIADRLGDQLGRSVFIYSITTDPEHDTPERLKAFAAQHGARRGWYFLTSAKRDIAEAKSDVAAVSRRLYKHGSHQGGHPARLVHYGNGTQGLWGAFGADTEPGLVVERLSWVQFGTQPTGRAKRAGPRRLAGDFTSENRT
jgi:hypothetical protein